MNLYGVTGMATEQHAVFGTSMDGMKSGVSGVTISAGNIMELGKCLE